MSTMLSSKKNFVLNAERHELYKVANKIVTFNGSIIIRDKITNVNIMIPDTLEARQFFNLNTVDNIADNSVVVSDIDESNTDSTDSTININVTNTININAANTNAELIMDRPSTSSESCNTDLLVAQDSAPAKWTDANAVRALISQWKNHESDFKSTLIKNNKVWQMIADDLKKENPLWSFTATQCENKFKDVRKSYTKTKDHNNQSGAELKTCKFYDEMEAVLGEKPIVKSISISSSLKKRSLNTTSDDSDEKENKSSSRKKSKTKELDKWCQDKKISAKEREEARMQRHKEKMERQDKALLIYKEQMEKLLEKL